MRDIVAVITARGGSIRLPKKNIRTCLNGLLVQDKDLKTDNEHDLKIVTKKNPEKKEIEDLLFASKICKHTKSNTIVLVKNKQLISSRVSCFKNLLCIQQLKKMEKNYMILQEKE